MIKFTTHNITRSYDNKLVIPATPSILEKVLELLAKSKNGLEVTIKPYRKKRSLDANAYMWILCTKIADEMSKEYPKTKEQVYQDEVRQGTTFKKALIENVDIPEYKKQWSAKGIGWFMEMISESNQHQGYSWCRFYKGSSEYDTKEMSRLIDRIVIDAQELGIETKTPQELEGLKEQWGRKE